MLMKIEDLLEFGFYVNAGHVDYYDGKRHHRVGELTVDGSLNLTDQGTQMVNAMMTVHALSVLTAPADNEAEAKAAAEKAEADRVAAEAAAQPPAAPVNVEPPAGDIGLTLSTTPTGKPGELVAVYDKQEIKATDVGSLDDLLGAVKG